MLLDVPVGQTASAALNVTTGGSNVTAVFTRDTSGLMSFEVVLSGRLE